MLFSPGRQLQPEAVQAYSGLLALAAAADDRRTSSAFGGGSGGSGGSGSEDGAAAVAQQQEQQQQDQQQQQQPGQPPGDAGGGLDLSAVPATRAALESAAELAQRVLQDEKSSAEDMETAAAVLEYPCCAAGAPPVLPAACCCTERWLGPSCAPHLPQHRDHLLPTCPHPPAGLLRALGAQLSRPEYWATAYHLLRSPPFLTLLSLVVPRQPGLHGALLTLLGRALGALGNTNHDMAKGFLSVAVQVGAGGCWFVVAGGRLGGASTCHRAPCPPRRCSAHSRHCSPLLSRTARAAPQLVSAGRVFEVLRWAEEWKQRADPSLVRHLVFGILEVAAPPYSPEFAGSMLRCVGCCWAAAGRCCGACCWAAAAGRWRRTAAAATASVLGCLTRARIPPRGPPRPQHHDGCRHSAAAPVGARLGNQGSARRVCRRLRPGACRCWLPQWPACCLAALQPTCHPLQPTCPPLHSLATLASRPAAPTTAGPVQAAAERSRGAVPGRHLSRPPARRLLIAAPSAPPALPLPSLPRLALAATLPPLAAGWPHTCNGRCQRLEPVRGQCEGVAGASTRTQRGAESGGRVQ